MTRPQRWNRVSQALLRWVDPVRGEELRTHIDDATSQGEPLRAADTVSVLGMVARTQVRRAMGQLPLVLAGLPVALLCIAAYAWTYSTHFVPWDLMEEVPSTDPTAAAIRRATELALFVLVPLALLSGWRVAGAIRRGHPMLPAMFGLGLLVLISQAELFIERTAWFASEGRLRARHVDDVSPYSVGLLSISLLLPALYLTLDWVSRRNDSRSTTSKRTARATETRRPHVDSVAVAAVVAPLLVVFSSIAAVVLFLLLVWLAESFQLRHKLAATIALAAPVGAALLVGLDNIDDPGIGFFGSLAFFVVVLACIGGPSFARSRRGDKPTRFGAMTRPQRWNRVSQWLLRWVDPVRGDELRTHIDDATSAGAPLGPADAASVLRMAARTQAKRALAQLPLVIAGTPVMLLCILAYVMIYESHFRPWDPSTNGSVAMFRRVVDLVWVVLVPVALLSGWRVAKSIRQGNYVLPAAYLVGLFVLMSQADIFIERTAWFGDHGLDASQIDEVSPYSIGLLAVALALPLVYLTLDAIARKRRSKSPTVARPTLAVRMSDRSWDFVGVAALAAPVAFLWSMSGLLEPGLLLYLLLTWLAPSFGLKHKIAATLSVVVPVATVVTAALLAGPDGIDDPNVVVLVVFLGIFVIVWVWLATVVFRRAKVAASPGMASLVR